MELNKTRSFFYGLTLLWVMMLLGLGSWWLYLVFKLHSTLSGMNLPEIGSQQKFLNMMKWEGSFFFIFLVLLGASLFVMYFRDMRKSKSIQAFFASLSHELKTPLASMRLQAEVIKDLIQDEANANKQLNDLAKRLVDDTYKLEVELDKSLQLSRIEQDGNLTLSPVSLSRFLKRHKERLSSVELIITIPEDAQEVMADELALNVVFRNLFENSLRHHPALKKIEIITRRAEDGVEIIYDDFGSKFKGPIHLLGNLFYKFESTKGSGIGLYLIKNLMLKMRGHLYILNDERLKFRLVFAAPKGEDHV